MDRRKFIDPAVPKYSEQAKKKKLSAARELAKMALSPDKIYVPPEDQAGGMQKARKNIISQKAKDAGLIDD